MATNAKKAEALLAQCFPPFLTIEQIESGELDLGEQQDEFVAEIWEVLKVDDAERDKTAQKKLVELKAACAEEFGTKSNMAKLLQYFLSIAYERYWQ